VVGRNGCTPARGNDPAHHLFREDTGFTPDPNVFNQCPHGNWWFLPWHRAHLHYFERILRWAAEGPELMLPYWNSCDADQRELPAAFRAATVNGKDNPLHLPESVTFTDGQGKPQIFPLRDGPLLRGDTQLSAAVGTLKALSDVPFTTAKPLPGEPRLRQPAGVRRSAQLRLWCPGVGAAQPRPHCCRRQQRPGRRPRESLAERSDRQLLERALGSRGEAA
jgi:hypothetical protein